MPSDWMKEAAQALLPSAQVVGGLWQARKWPVPLSWDHSWLFVIPAPHWKGHWWKAVSDTTRWEQPWRAAVLTRGFLVSKEIKQHGSVFLVARVGLWFGWCRLLAFWLLSNTAGSPGVCHPGWADFCPNSLPCIPAITASLGGKEKPQIPMNV